MEASTTRIVVPWARGQAVEQAARILASELSDLGAGNYVLDLRPGDSGVTGTEIVAHADPDGSTLLAASTGPLVLTPMEREVPYDTARDFRMIAIFGITGYVLMARADLGCNTASELIDLVAKAPGRFRYGVTGKMTTPHRAALLAFSAFGLEVMTSTFDGTAEVMDAITAGEIDIAMESVSGSLPSLQLPELVGLGTSLAAGSRLLPGVPPLARTTGLEGYDIGAWVGIAGPALLPDPLIDRTASLIRSCASNPEFQTRLLAIGIEPIFFSADGAKQIISKQAAFFSSSRSDRP